MALGKGILCMLWFNTFLAQILQFGRGSHLNHSDGAENCGNYITFLEVTWCIILSPLALFRYLILAGWFSPSTIIVSSLVICRPFFQSCRSLPSFMPWRNLSEVLFLVGVLRHQIGTYALTPVFVSAPRSRTYMAYN
jgi:hypothetical protein